METEIIAYYKAQAKNLNQLKNILTNNKMIILDDSKKQISPKKIVELIEDIFDTNIKVKNRKQGTIFGRKAAAYILKTHTKLSLNEIAELIGVNDHSTVLYNIKTATDLILTEDWYKIKIEQIQSELKNYGIFVNN